jgi:Tfp pilus assembly PilM family ATPase
MVETEEGSVRTLGTRELIQPFDLKTFYSSGEFLDNQTEVLRDLYEKIGCQSTEVGIALGNEMVLIEKIPVALGLEEGSLEDHLSWEMEQLLIAPPDDYVMASGKLPFQASGGNPVYLLTLVRKSVVRGIRSLVQSIGLSPRDIDVDVFSNIRALLKNYEMEENAVSVLMDIQRNRISFFFIRSQEYFLSHRIFIKEGGSAAEFHNSSDIVDLLMKELRRLVFGHRLGRSVEDLACIFLLGNEVVREIAKELTSTTSVPLRVVNPFQQIQVAKSVSTSREFIDFPERYTTAVGVVLKRVPSLAR